MSAIPRPVRGLAFAVAGLVASIGAVQLAAPPVHADDWCIFDPVISINGQQTHILVGVQGISAAAAVVAHTVVYVPAGVSTSLVELPSGGPFPESVSFVTVGKYHYSGNGPVPFAVTTTFTSLNKLNTDMQVTFASGASKTVYGSTHSTLVVVSTN